VSSDFISISKLIPPFPDPVQSSKDCDIAVNALAFPSTHNALGTHCGLPRWLHYPSIHLSVYPPRKQTQLTKPTSETPNRNFILNSEHKAKLTQPTQENIKCGNFLRE